MTLTPHSIIHGDAYFAYFNKIWGIPPSTWVTHIAPRLVGPGAAYHSHPGLAGLGACAFAASTPTIAAKMPRPAIKARFMISSLWINNCGA